MSQRHDETIADYLVRRQKELEEHDAQHIETPKVDATQISLRDFFAGCELINRSIVYAILSLQPGEDIPFWPGREELSNECFEQADAMLAARKEQNNE